MENFDKGCYDIPNESRQLMQEDYIMNDEYIQKTAYLYGRNTEKLKLIEADTNAEDYQEYDALCRSLWRELLDNDAIQNDGTLKAQYSDAVQFGRESVAVY
jgi:hypothetical protein